MSNPTPEAPAASCQFCGTAFPASTGRGRPRSYCGKTCASLAEALNRVRTSTSLGPLSVEQAKALRSELWSLCNLHRCNGG